jgi:hypothetical protein
MSPSSTSSSETLPRWRTPRALVAAAVVLLCVEIIVARRDWIWSRDPASPSGVIDAMEQLIIRKASPPTVLVMGSSRARDAIVPAVLERELGLPRGAVMNLGITGGTPFDGLTLYRRNRDRLRHAQLLVFAIEDWHLNESFPPGVLDRRFATLDERIGVFDRDATLSLVVGWLWRTYDAQEPLRELGASVTRDGSRTLRVTDDGRIGWRRQELEEGPTSVDVQTSVAQFYTPFRLGRGRLRQLEQLLALARQDGLQALVVRLPWRDAYVDAVRARYADQLDATAALTRDVAGARVVLFERASALGIPEHWFYDYGHLTLLGARRLTGRLAPHVAAALAGRSASGP